MKNETEVTSAAVAALASQGLADPASLTHDQIRSVCASALSQAPDRSYGPDDERHGEAEAEACGAAAERERALKLAADLRDSAFQIDRILDWHTRMPTASRGDSFEAGFKEALRELARRLEEKP